MKVVHEVDGEQYIRLAYSRGSKTGRPWTTHERYQLYAAGFRAGAGMRPIDGDRSGLGAYDRGYADGLKAMREAVSAYAGRIGYEPTILRAAEPNRNDTEEP
jgi:hypothetical protein